MGVGFLQEGKHLRFLVGTAGRGRAVAVKIQCRFIAGCGIGSARLGVLGYVCILASGNILSRAIEARYLNIIDSGILRRLFGAIIGRISLGNLRRITRLIAGKRGVHRAGDAVAGGFGEDLVHEARHKTYGAAENQPTSQLGGNTGLFLFFLAQDIGQEGDAV